MISPPPAARGGKFAYTGVREGLDMSVPTKTREEGSCVRRRGNSVEGSGWACSGIVLFCRRLKDFAERVPATSSRKHELETAVISDMACGRAK